MAGKPRFTEAEVETALLANGTLTGAADELRCSPRTLSNYVKDSPTLQEARAQGLAAVADRAETNVARAIAEGDVKASQWFLVNAPPGKDRGYGKRQEIEQATVMIDPESFSPRRPESWEELRQKWNLSEPIVIEDTASARTESPPTMLREKG